MVGEGLLQSQGDIVDGNAAEVAVQQRVSYLAINVELKLRESSISDAYRP
jgi:hypothetical protein